MLPFQLELRKFFPFASLSDLFLLGLLLFQPLLFCRFSSESVLVPRSAPGILSRGKRLASPASEDGRLGRVMLVRRGLGALQVDARHAAKVQGLKLPGSRAFPGSEGQLLQEFLRPVIADRYRSRQLFDARSLKGDAVVLTLLLTSLPSHLPGGVEAAIDNSVCRCIGIVISGTHNRWNPRLAVLRNRGTNDRSSLVVARSPMLVDTSLFIQRILSEEILLCIISSIRRLLLLRMSYGLSVVDRVHTLHRSLQVFVLGVEVTMRTYVELFLRSSCSSLILLRALLAIIPGPAGCSCMALLALFHSPASWRQIDALVQS